MTNAFINNHTFMKKAFIVLATVAVFGAVHPVSAQTVPQTRAELIQQILALIAELNRQVQVLQAQETASSSSPVIVPPDLVGTFYAPASQRDIDDAVALRRQVEKQMSMDMACKPLPYKAPSIRGGVTEKPQSPSERRTWDRIYDLMCKQAGY